MNLRIINNSYTAGVIVELRIIKVRVIETKDFHNHFMCLSGGTVRIYIEGCQITFDSGFPVTLFTIYICLLYTSPSPRD